MQEDEGEADPVQPTHPSCFIYEPSKLYVAGAPRQRLGRGD
jgi:hypothetical protein